MVRPTPSPPWHPPMPVFEVEPPLSIERAFQALLLTTRELVCLVVLQNESQPYEKALV